MRVLAIALSSTLGSCWTTHVYAVWSELGAALCTFALETGYLRASQGSQQRKERTNVGGRVERRRLDWLCA